MIRKIEIENFKSVKKLELELGRVTVLIGENGAGKSNILEAIAFGAAAAADKLENEFLGSRGIRATVSNSDYLPAFSKLGRKQAIFISITDAIGQHSDYEIEPVVDANVGSWTVRLFEDTITGRKGKYAHQIHLSSEYVDWLIRAAERQAAEDADNELPEPLKVSKNFLNRLFKRPVKSGDEKRPDYLMNFEHFLMFSPENRELRTFAEEGQILPLGIRGEGLFRLLKILSQQDNGAKLAILKEKLQLIDWFADFEFQQDAMAYERRLLIRDRHLSGDLSYFDQRSANEGFLFLLFYFCLFLSDATPPFFAIDNIDSSLNPKLCSQLVRELVQMAKTYGKQVILTTHNPAVLDGLNLKDEEQRLYVVRRDIDGETIARRVLAPTVPEGQRAVPLSEAFLRGYIGGLPNNF